MCNTDQNAGATELGPKDVPDYLILSARQLEGQDAGRRVSIVFDAKDLQDRIVWAGRVKNFLWRFGFGYSVDEFADAVIASLDDVPDDVDLEDESQLQAIANDLDRFAEEEMRHHIRELAANRILRGDAEPGESTALFDRWRRDFGADPYAVYGVLVDKALNAPLYKWCSDHCALSTEQIARHVEDARRRRAEVQDRRDNHCDLDE